MSCRIVVWSGWARNDRFFGFGLNNWMVPVTKVKKTGRGTS